MKKILLVCLLFNSIFISAQVTFSDENIIERTDADGASSVFAIDIDGDGDNDVLSASQFDNKIAWYENIDGNGDFGIQQVITIDADGANSVFAADIDGDGDIDVLSASIEDNKIAWYENENGDGIFGPQQVITTEANGNSSIYMADIDGDGDTDLLFASFGNKISWCENTDGLGTFGAQQIITIEVNTVRSVFAADIDGDGDIDVLSASFIDDKIAWYENNGNGNFGAQQIISTDANAARSVFSVDIDSDSDMDVLSVSSNKVAWYENTDGNGTFGSQQIISTASSTTVFAADIDNDGDVDVIVKDGISKIRWYENTDGVGNFENQQIISSNAFLVSAVFVSDINGDGDMDVLSTSAGDDKVAWYENIDGNGDFGAQQIITTDADGVKSIFAADIDSDGDLDILSASSNDDKVAWYENIDGNGDFGAQQIITTVADGACSVFASDIDSDGDIDVISASFNDDKITWYENTDGTGDFGPAQIITTDANYANSVYAADIDGDGDMDILSASEEDDKVAWYENTNGVGTFGLQQIISNNVAGASSVFAVDIDGDDDIDVIAVSTVDNKIIWHENIDGSGTFGPQQVISTNTENDLSFFTVDIDGDGDIDVLSASQLDDRITWYENVDGVGTFGPQQVISTATDYARSVIAADLDNDGDMDVLSISSGDNKTAWYENVDGNGNFGPQQVILIDTGNPDFNYVGSPRSVIAGDIDGDGDIDIFSASADQNYHKIVFFKNLGALRNNIFGYVKLDNNQGDCIANGIPLTDVLVDTDNGTESFSTFTITNGIYQIFPGTGDFTTTVTLPEPYSNYYTLTPDEYTNGFVDIGNTFLADFCLEPIAIFNDLNITILPLDQANPGFEAKYRIVYKNVGTTQLSGSVDFNYDNAKLAFLSASESISAQTSNSISFDYLDLAPFETTTIDLVFTVFTPPTVQAGDVIDFEATINPIVEDETQEDNTYSFSQTVVGSYDPNDITCLEGEEVLLEDADKYLHYLIRFQNTGDFYATFVRVHNTLDDHLDWSTIQMVDASHDYKVEILDGNEVDFIFDAIYLQDSTTDETNSHGFISYKIKPKSDVVVGDIISSQAGIYFDFNPVVNTNTYDTEIVDIIDIDEPALLNFSIYPTPTEEVLNIASKEPISKIVIYNKLGQTILETAEKTINVSSLVQGVYFVKVIDENGHAGVQKIVKK